MGGFRSYFNHFKAFLEILNTFIFTESIAFIVL